MHWLALYCPTLPLDCILRRWPAGLDPALAVTDLDGSRRLVMVATRSARAGGIFAGQSIATALALLPDLVLVPRKPEDEHRALTEAALAALRFTPTVSLRASGLVMEISASLKLFGGGRVLKKDVVATMKTQGLRIATAEAPTPHGAWLMAQESARRRQAASRDIDPDGAATASSTGRRLSKATTASPIYRQRPTPSTSSNPSAQSAVPSAVPSLVQSAVLSAMPSLVHSVVPPTVPYLMQSAVPSAVPSLVQSEVPPTVPSLVQSAVPTAVPFLLQSVVPPAVPSLVQSAVPSSRQPAVPPAEQSAGHTKVSSAKSFEAHSAITSAKSSTKSFETHPAARSAWPSSVSSPVPAADVSGVSPTQPVLGQQAGFLAALDAVPIAHLDHGRPLLRRMDGIGCYTIADLRRLPTKGLARRFGTALTDELARALGDKPDPQVVFVAPARFDARVELMARVETAEALVFACQRLLVQLTGWLSARRAAVRGFTVMLHHDRWTRDAIEPTPVAIALAAPTRELDRLFTLVRERLSRLELKAPVLELVLEAPTIVEEEETEGRLFPERDQAIDSLGRLLEKLTVRLGQEAATRVERVADHRPERAWRTVPADLFGQQADLSKTRKLRGLAKVSSATTASPPEVSTFMTPLTSGCTCGPRPAWLLTEPRQLEIRADRPYLESQRLQLVAGPERIESGWWDDAAVTRDYFIAENAAGHLVWIYRERLVTADRPQWFLQGLFA